MTIFLLCYKVEQDLNADEHRCHCFSYQKHSRTGFQAFSAISLIHKSSNFFQTTYQYIFQTLSVPLNIFKYFFEINEEKHLLPVCWVYDSVHTVSWALKTTKDLTIGSEPWSQPPALYCSVSCLGERCCIRALTLKFVPFSVDIMVLGSDQGTDQVLRNHTVLILLKTL